MFESLLHVLGHAIFERLHQPDWGSVQAEAVRWSCASDERDAFVAVTEGLTVGFATVALNAFHERMGVVDMIAVDPRYQRRGIARQLMDHSIEHMRTQGMDIVAVETGGDPGHGPARQRSMNRSATRHYPASGTSGCSTDALIGCSCS